jgi:hypothetical protein
MVNLIEAFSDVDFERELRSVSNRCEDGSDGIMTGPSWTKAIGMGGKLGFPFRFKGLTHQSLSRPIRLSGNAKGPFVRGGTPFGNPNAPQRAGRAVETELVS